ncbi:hypothetical protein [Brevibacillus panacihumi]|uniref:hypothetical protein n=1 Tax=Brevibacillus panacihumi TaxID=497735 RepID=UPI0026C0FD78
MIEIIESLIPANIDFTTALLIIVLCAVIDILSPGVLAITAYILLIQKEKTASRLIVFFIFDTILLFYNGYLGLSLSWADSWFYRKHGEQSNFKLVLYDSWSHLCTH